jgi:hypothetical protein
VGIVRCTEFRVGGSAGVAASYVRPVAVEVEGPSGGVTRHRILDLDLALRVVLAVVAVIAVLRGRSGR